MPPLPKQKGSGQEEEAATTGETSIKKPLSISPPEKDQMRLATSHVTTLVCRTKYFIPAWQEITADRQILEMVRGSPIEFKGMPNQLSAADSFSVNLIERETINTEVDTLLNKGVIEETTQLESKFISNIFVRKKKDSAYRMILNLKNLNYSIERKHFKIDTFLSSVNLVRQNSYIASVDL